MTALIGSALVVGATPFITGGQWLGHVPVTPVDAMSIVAVILLAAATLATVRLREQRLAAVVALGVVGLVVILAFVHFSAPDLAITQITVEIVTTILLLLALFFMPGKPSGKPRFHRWHALIATIAGLGTAALLLAVLTRPYTTTAGYFLENAKPLGGGSNVVNVILVDFRSFDTLGEITVLAIAAAATYALLHGLQLALPRRDSAGRPWAREGHPLPLAILSRPLLPLALLVALFMLLRGHNAPGGGFIAGLIAATALILQFLANGIEWTQGRMRLHYFRIVGAGLAVASLTGIASLFYARPFLTSTVVHLSLPLLGEMELASAMLFDVGVFTAVIGVVMLILAHLGKLSRLQIAVQRETPEEGE